MTTLLIAEHDGQALKAATLNALTAAQALDQPIAVLVMSATDTVAQQAARLPTVSRVLLAKGDCFAHPMAAVMAPTVVANLSGVTHVLAAATTFGKDLLPRVAALADVDCLTDVTAVLSGERFQRPIYAGNAIATVHSRDPLKVLSVRASAFAAAMPGEQEAPIEPATLGEVPAHTAFVGAELAQSDRPELTAASVVVSGGRGVGSRENFDLVFELADKLGGAVGASRAAVDAGYVANDLQVGQTGKVVAPDLYIAIGISGAIQHLAGMKSSKVVVAINSDPEAPIFESADYGLVGDLFTVLPELTAKI